MSEEQNKCMEVRKQRPASRWCCMLLGTWESGAIFTPCEGDEPNWFHRLMQRFCFGFKWEKR